MPNNEELPYNVDMEITCPSGWKLTIYIYADQDKAGEAIKDFMGMQLELWNLHRNIHETKKAGLSSHKMTGRKE